MKRFLAALVAVIMALCPLTLAETETETLFADEDFGFDFMDDGYTGEWVSVAGLGFEFCLPEGWVQSAATDGAAFFATGADASATLTIRAEAEGVTDLTAWGESHLAKYELDEANFYDALIVEEEQSITLFAVICDERLVSFAFSRVNADALPREFALQIVGSACVTWEDAGIDPVEDGGEGAFDFGEAFEGDLG